MLVTRHQSSLVMMRRDAFRLLRRAAGAMFAYHVVLRYA